MESIFYLVPVAAVTALGFAWHFFRQMKKQDEGTDRMKAIAKHVREGAMSYLKQQYKMVTIVFIILAALFAVMAAFGLQNSWVPFAFLTGGFFSGLAGYFGMKTATYASARTANAASKSLNKGLQVAFRSGAVMGLVVVGLALVDISAWYLILNFFVDEPDPAQKTMFITTTMLTFGMGASTQALFARVGGGIYTKAADVGADLVGKVEAGIPEDDPRNPATIADNVGDNVGDVAGMGADLYESYCGSVLATAALGASAFMMNPAMQTKAVLAPMIIAAVGIFLSIFGIFLVKTKENADMKQLMAALNRGVNTSAVLIAVLTFVILWLLGIENWVGISFSVICGLVAGIIIGQGTEYYTSHSYKPTRKVAKSAETGPATVIISGLGLGMISTAIPVVTIVAAIILSYLCAIQFDVAHMLSAQNLSIGLYGIGIAAVGMLSTLGITLATDAYGPIADNAGGNAEMSGLGAEVRRRTDALDALGNTTAATGKGFAIGSAALTALALLASYIEEIKIGLVRIAEKSADGLVQVGEQIPHMPDAVPGSMKVKDLNGWLKDEYGDYILDEQGRRQLSGKPDGNIDDADKVIICNEAPDLSFGMGNYFYWKNFDLSFFFYGEVGRQMYNRTRPGFVHAYQFRYGDNILVDARDRWSHTNQDGKYPSNLFEKYDGSNDFWVEDADFLRLKSITLGYTLPKHWFNGLFSSARLYFDAQNLFVITNYTGSDPETDSYSAYPNQKTFSFGVELNF